MSTVVAPEAPADRLAQQLAEGLGRGAGGTMTWLNHYSALQALDAGVPLHRFDYLGLDGILLCRLVKTECARTSADLLMPALLQRSSNLRIALIGSTADTLRTVAAKIEAQNGHTVVLMRDGYGDLPEPAVMRRQLRAAGVQLAVVGLGAPKQDLYVLDLATPGVFVATCGGWLDQYAGDDDYYPAWAYPLRLNWLIRLAREPRRLWRRYTLDALRAFRARKALTEYVAGLGRGPLRAVQRGANVPLAHQPAA